MYKSNNTFDSLSSLLTTKKVTKNENHFEFPSLPYQEDGVNCINIWINGETELGRVLDKSFKMQFKHKQLGNFTSIDGIWNYLLSGDFDDRLRYATGKHLTYLARKLEENKEKNAEIFTPINFRAIILDSTFQKIKNFPNLEIAVKESNLPFDCWFVDKETKVKQRLIKYGYWFIPGIEEIRLALKENREPNLTKWKRNPDKGIYDDVLEKIRQSYIEESIENITSEIVPNSDEELKILAQQNSIMLENITQ